MYKGTRHINKDIDIKAIGRNIEFYRKCNDYSAKYVAEMTGMGHSTIQNYERGRYRPSMNAIEKLARLFKVSVDDLLYTDKQMEKDERKSNPDSGINKKVKPQVNRPKQAVSFRMDAKDFVMLNKVLKATGKTQIKFVADAIRTEYAKMWEQKHSTVRREFNGWNHKCRVVKGV
jgi:transcriptional regulator with XRE-family HTH domain